MQRLTHESRVLACQHVSLENLEVGVLLARSPVNVERVICQKVPILPCRQCIVDCHAAASVKFIVSRLASGPTVGLLDEARRTSDAQVAIQEPQGQLWIDQACGGRLSVFDRS
jgi:hypothetical protein